MLSYVTVMAGAANETTNLLIGWTGKVLGEHPDARRAVVEDRSSVANTIEEILRSSPPSPPVHRLVRGR